MFSGEKGPEKKEYKRKVGHSTEAAMVTFSSSLDDKSRAIASKIETVSNEFTAVKFYQVDVRKHTMLHSAYLNEELPLPDLMRRGSRWPGCPP